MPPKLSIPELLKILQVGIKDNIDMSFYSACGYSTPPKREVEVQECEVVEPLALEESNERNS